MIQREPCRVLVLGGLGRLGRTILDLLMNDSRYKVVGVLEREPSSEFEANDFPVVSSPDDLTTEADVVIDATIAEAVSNNVLWAAHNHLPYVLAVTGCDRVTRENVEMAARQIPVLTASNLSMGITVIDALIGAVANRLPEADIEIVETHHRAKQDVPSGTALTLAKTIQDNLPGHKEIVLGLGKGARDKEIRIHALRSGDVIGEHQVSFYLDGERITISHCATSRCVFARGALNAARFIWGRGPGLYFMRDVLKGDGTL